VARVRPAAGVEPDDLTVVELCPLPQARAAHRLSTGSPCIDAGDNSAVPDDVTTDLDGNPRFVDDPYTEDTGVGDPPIVDMGAYECAPQACAWDLDDSGSVDTVDFLDLLGQWGQPGPADFDGSCSVGAAVQARVSRCSHLPVAPPALPRDTTPACHGRQPHPADRPGGPRERRRRLGPRGHGGARLGDRASWAAS